MLAKIILMSLLLVGPASWADASSNVKVPVKEGFETMDMNQFKDLAAPTTRSRPGVSLTTSCRTKNGTEYKATDAGYQTCLSEAQTDRAGNTRPAGSSPSVQFNTDN